MTSLDAKLLVRRFLTEAWNGYDLAVVDEVIHPAYRVPGIGTGPDAVRRNIADFHVGFPDLRWEIADIIAEGDRVAARFTLHGTHLGRFHQYEPTGRGVSMQELGIWRVEDGKLREAWFTFDGVGLRHQLGVLDPRPKVTEVG